MKKIINIVGVSALLFTCVSCQDWLDMPSESKADSSSVFETVGRAEMVVVGAYPNIHTQELGYQLLEGTDEASSSETNSKYNVSNYDYTSTSSMLSSTYTNMYKAIEYVNVCIKNIPSMKVAESEQKKLNSLLGEALAIRAYAYWNIVRFYGDVPYTDIPTSDLTTFSSSRVSRDTIYDHCVRDLQQAIDLLPWQSEGMVSTPERFTKNSAYGILARVALYAAGYSLRWDLSTVPYNASTVRIAQREDKARIHELYQIAADACKAVITQKENGLLDNYDEVFRDLCTKQYNEETMLEYGWYGANSSDVRTGYVNGIPTNGSGGTFGKGGAQMITMPTFYFEFDEGDQRRDVSICNYGLYTDGTYQMNTYIGSGVGKYRINWCKSRGTSDSRRDINFPLLRYSDVLLMYAEAANENHDGPTTEAKDALKQVRKRAFAEKDHAEKVEAYVDALGTKEDFFNAIVQERAWEFGGEKHRRYDLARWNLYGKTLYNLYFDWIELGKVARTKQYENTETPFENPTYDARFDSYPAVAYYKMVPADKTLFPVCVAETMDWYKEGNINSYDEALPAYPSQNPSGYSRVDMCVQYCTQVKNASPRQWEPSARILHSFYGYINASNAGAVNPETDPVRYLVPIPPDALSSHQGLLKNYYGY